MSLRKPYDVTEGLRAAADHRAAGRSREADAVLRLLLARDPMERRARIALALAAADEQRPGEALSLLQDGLRLDPAAGDLLFFLGRLQRADLPGDAANAFGRAVRLEPRATAFRLAHADALAAAGYLPESLGAHLEAVRIAEDPAPALGGMAAVLSRLGQRDRAIAVLRSFVLVRPDRSAGYADLASLQLQRGRVQAARVLAGRAIRLTPDAPGVLTSAALAIAASGDTVAALATLDRALALAPGSAAARAARVFLLDFDPGAGTAEQQAARRAMRACLPPPDAVAHANDPDPERRLRVGYVSPDFRTHALSELAGPVLLGHAPAAVETFLYSDFVLADATTRRLRDAADHWRDSAGWSTSELLARVRADGIDVLVDLAMHTAGNRLDLFARRAAPVQVTAWGHLGGTGLPEIDALLSDPVAVPAGEAGLFAESVRYLPCWTAFQPPAGAPEPAVADVGRPFTLGSYNRFAKLLPAALPVWAEILGRLPAARLVLKSAELDEPASRAALLERFAALGVAPGRIDLLPFTPMPAHLADYHRLDLALDPFPHGGGVTTLQALWMGVPVLTLAGRTPVGRAGAAILAVLGLDDLIARSPERYVERAVALAGDREGLGRLSAGLRARLQASPICSPGYVRAVEAVYRDLWREWCGRRQSLPVADPARCGGEARDGIRGAGAT